MTAETNDPLYAKHGIRTEHQQLIIKFLAALFPKARIYLFGSRARGTYSVGSDIDIAIDNGQKIPLPELWRAKSILNDINTPQNVDVIDYHRIPASMLEEIQKEGILWN
jgi:predicted nucleotidyltransferase